jgi:uncharacterized membrane protein YciS (DUF1049 family)
VEGLRPVLQALLATLFAWGLTAAGVVVGLAVMRLLDVALG